MKNFIQNKLVIVLLVFFVCSKNILAQNQNLASLKLIPKELKGNFKDDYDITYTINDSVWIQHPGGTYHLLKYDSTGKYFIAKNDEANRVSAGLFTRIDIMYFKNMEPWQWGFCLTAYDAKTFEEAESKISADRNNPKKGCGGFPFSRMKRE